MAILIIIIVIVVILIWAILTYNSLVRKRLLTENSNSDILVQIKRRADLIPNLVNTVKGYATHEKDTLARIVELRNSVVNPNTSDSDKIAADNELGQAIGRLLVTVEAYPDLKANENFLSLQEELTNTENKVGYSRQRFNSSVTEYNQAIRVFPASIIASIFKFTPVQFIQLNVSANDDSPTVSF